MAVLHDILWRMTEHYIGTLSPMFLDLLNLKHMDLLCAHGHEYMYQLQTNWVM